MGKLAKSVFLKIPANVAYEALKNVDATRYTSDLTGVSSHSGFATDVPNTLLVLEVSKSGFLAPQARWEYSMRSLSETTCEVTLKIDYKNVDETFVKVIFASAIECLMMLEYGYDLGKK